ncbi:protein kinase family protein [Streptomyces sp. NPDC014733]|uniref:protein kinase family protein n=1 Tax=Streptomyces sp. NPDC014733 TaxID=3364885 RepID=UPI003701F8EB
MEDRELTAPRVSAYADVSTRLALLSDSRLGDALATSSELGSGVGGRSAQLQVEGVPVFVKRIPLTDREMRPENLRSTANLFDLPLFYQYGIGSAGFGAWRELAAHVMTTGWVLENACTDFPLMYHWRILPDQPPTGFMDLFGGLEATVAHWEGSPAVRRRLEEIGASSFSLFLFLEYVPRTLSIWLDEKREERAAGAAIESPYPWVEKSLKRGIEFMRSRGLSHFDAHFRNVLTDGRQLYFTDFGLAVSNRFALSAEESAFLTLHAGYDRGYTVSHLLRHHALKEVCDDDGREAFLQDWIAGRRPEVPPEIGALLDRYARCAVALEAFHRRLLRKSKTTPYPALEIQQALNSVCGPLS